jgi:hypothetical protein
MRGLIVKNRANRAGAVDGLNLFFGALLGANLGTLDNLKLVHYVQLIVLLAAIVLSLRLVSTADKRWPVITLLGVYGAMLAAIAAIPDLQPQGLRVEDFHKLVATIAVWVALALALELAPVRQKATEGVDPAEGEEKH